MNIIIFIWISCQLFWKFTPNFPSLLLQRFCCCLFQCRWCDSSHGSNAGLRFTNQLISLFALFLLISAFICRPIGDDFCDYVICEFGNFQVQINEAWKVKSAAPDPTLLPKSKLQAKWVPHLHFNISVFLHHRLKWRILARSSFQLPW